VPGKGKKEKNRPLARSEKQGQWEGEEDTPLFNGQQMEYASSKKNHPRPINVVEHNGGKSP